METTPQFSGQPKTPEPVPKSGGVLIALGVFGLVIIGLFVLWFFFAPKSAHAPDDSADVVSTETTEEKPAASGKPAAQLTSSSDAYPAAGARIFENGVYVTIIRFDGKKFSPDSVVVEPTEEVRFVNTSNLTMDIGTRAKDSSPVYSSFSQPTAKGKGGTYQIAFTQLGVWAYENTTSKPTITGSVFVK